eukprot:TRINITY_DN7396_c0_g1_i1.p1 TRINITY_DN7396_c0_g1~~TRINITY_DN7396_c0_g1_i1.p1  ORF type:complete len:813 (+),score=122.10 TRINITY_DN7396_c0_g1_i1:230-2440(+)
MPHSPAVMPSIPNVSAVWLGRDKLLDWHQRLGHRFSDLVVGFYIRFRLEDQPNGKAHYKVGRMRRVTDDWHIYIDLGKGPRDRGDTTGIDCVSNSVFNPDEIRMWYEGVDRSAIATILTDLQRTTEKMRVVEDELKAMGDPAVPRRAARRQQRGQHDGYTPRGYTGEWQAPSPQQHQPPPQQSPQDDYSRWVQQRQPHYLARSDTGIPQRSQQEGPVTPAKPAQSHVITPVTPPTPPGLGLHGAATPPPTAMLGGYNDLAGRDGRARSRSRSRSHSRSPPPPGVPRAAGGAVAHRRSPHCQLCPVVLLIDEHGSTKGSSLISQVVSRATCVEADTPTAGAGRQFDPFATFDVGQEQDIMGTESTILRVKELEAEPRCDLDKPKEAQRVLHMLREARVDAQTFQYKKPREFAQAVLSLCRAVTLVLEREPLLIRRSSPVYVFGDIHGNFVDLTYFMDRLIPFGEIMYAPCDFIFLGDYVDRGTCSIECMTWLLAHKLMAPDKVTLLRGNHESPEVSGDVATYGNVSFKHQCLQIFGDDLGQQVWAGVNSLFKHMSLACVLDNRIFCSHGGIPQYYGGPDSRIDLLEKQGFPRFDEVQSATPDPETREYRQFVSDLLWSDPAEAGAQLNEHGFGENPRGPGITTFGSRAVDAFLSNHNFDYIIRAHQEKANGLRISDNARVLTVFSSSDYGGHQNGAGVLYVGGGLIRMIIKDPVPVVRQPEEDLGLQPPPHSRPDRW